MYVAAGLTRLQPIPEALQQPLLGAMPGPLFGLLIDSLQHFGKVLEEAALIDGCTRLRALVKVVVPIVAPGLAVVALFAFIATWNEFLFAVVLTGIETKTMMVLVTTFTSGGTDAFFGEASASVVLGVLPAFAVAFMLQRYLVKGLALGGTKG